MYNFETEEAYCAIFGFSLKINSSNRLRQIEIVFFDRTVAEAQYVGPNLI